MPRTSRTARLCACKPRATGDAVCARPRPLVRDFDWPLMRIQVSIQAEFPSTCIQAKCARPNANLCRVRFLKYDRLRCETEREAGRLGRISDVAVQSTVPVRFSDPKGQPFLEWFCLCRKCCSWTISDLPYHLVKELKHFCFGVEATSIPRDRHVIRGRRRAVGFQFHNQLSACQYSHAAIIVLRKWTRLLAERLDRI